MADKRKRKRKPYTLRQVQLIGSHALAEVERILLDPASSTHDKLRAAAVISSLHNAYAKLAETADLEQRIEALENETTQTT